MAINDEVLFLVTTWSGENFRTLGSSDFFYKWTDFKSQKVHGYGGYGLNLQGYLNRTADNETIAKLYHVTLHAYLVRET